MKTRSQHICQEPLERLHEKGVFELSCKNRGVGQGRIVEGTLLKTCGLRGCCKQLAMNGSRGPLERGRR
jgi:hypothetical protein